jgi:hypothetical protein
METLHADLIPLFIQPVGQCLGFSNMQRDLFGAFPAFSERKWALWDDLGFRTEFNRPALQMHILLLPEVLSR